VISKKIKLGKSKLNYWRVGVGNHMHINLGRYKKGKDVDINVVYCSITEKDDPYCEIWLDKQGNVPVGIELMWDDPERGTTKP
jgi:hypothetical protein